MNMKFIITESQFKKLFESSPNFKPAREFDKVFGTELGQSYNFGKGKTSDDVWEIIDNCYENRDCDEFKDLIHNLDENMFPYPNVDKFDIPTKIEIIQGMASEFNFEDIVDFAIRKITGLNNKPFNKFWNSLSSKEADLVQWVPSKETLKIIKKVMKKK